MEVFPERKPPKENLPIVSDSMAPDSTDMNDNNHKEATHDVEMTRKEGNSLNDTNAAAENAQAAKSLESTQGASVTSSSMETINSEASLTTVTPLSTEKSVAPPVAAMDDEPMAANTNSPSQQPATQESGDQPLVTKDGTRVNEESEVRPDSDNTGSVNGTERSGEMQALQSDEVMTNGATPNDQAQETAAHAVYTHQQEARDVPENPSSETLMGDTFVKRPFEPPVDEPSSNTGGSSASRPTMNGMGLNKKDNSESSLSDAQIDTIVAGMMDEAGADPAPVSNNGHTQTPVEAAISEGQPTGMSMTTNHGLQDGKPPPVAGTTNDSFGVRHSANVVAESHESVGSSKSSSGASSASAAVIDLLDSDDEEDSNLDTSQQTGPPAAKRQRMEETSVSAGAAAHSAVARMPNGTVQRHNYAAASAPDPYRNPIYLQPLRDFIPTWRNLTPVARQEQPRPPPTGRKKAFQLTLLNVSEFTITPLHVGDEYSGHMTSLAGLRTIIKKVSKDHGKAFFEQDPDGGKWHIPLGAYHAFVGVLGEDEHLHHLEGISNAQLNIASLGKARLEKEFPSARKLVKLGVPKKLADTLAPFQRGGVDFVIEKEGRALIADEMGLGKTIQGIASMAVYHEEWPILVLCPSSARYHWESEFRAWLGRASATAEHAGAFDAEEGKESEEEEDEASFEPRSPMPPLENDQINVLTSGQDELFPNPSTKVVICSYGLAPNLALSGRLPPGLFRCAIVDESHMLKNKATQRTKNLLPVLKATSRCVLLSGTPAFARPTELWPQLDILGCKRHGWWQDEAEFMKKYARGSKQRRAELHTMLLGTVMIRRMKHDILKSLPAKIREQGVVDVMDDSTRMEMKKCMFTLRSGKGKLSELARGSETDQEQDSTESQASVSAVAAHRDEEAAAAQLKAATAHLDQEIEQHRANGRRQIQHTLSQNPAMDPMTVQTFAQQMESRLEDQLRTHYQERSLAIQRDIRAGTYSGPGADVAQPDPASEKKLVLNHMYTLTGKCKVPLVVEMLKRWLNDPTKGKLCIFAHHISILDELVSGAGLSNAAGSSTKYIRIDGSTTPRSRQDQINTFQRDSSVRIAILGITAAGVAVTLTASSTVWFAELFWTPAIMVQAEDRCHRIGQQAQVKCLYFVAKGTLDELLWKLLENKFQALGEFVEGKEKLKIVVNNTYHSSHELLKTVTPDDEDENLSDAGSECSLSDVQEISSDLEHEIEELGLSEQNLLATAEDNEDFEPGNRAETDVDAKPAAKAKTANTVGTSVEEAICLSDDDEVEEVHPAQANAPKEAPATGAGTIPQQAVATRPAIFNLNTATFPDLRIYRLYFSGPTYGINFTFIEGRLVVTGIEEDRKQRFGPGVKPDVGEVLVGINRAFVPLVQNMQVVLKVLGEAKKQNRGISELMFAEDPSIKTYVIEKMTREMDRQVAAAQQAAVASATAKVNDASGDVIEID